MKLKILYDNNMTDIKQKNFFTRAMYRYGQVPYNPEWWGVNRDNARRAVYRTALFVLPKDGSFLEDQTKEKEALTQALNSEQFEHDLGLVGVDPKRFRVEVLKNYTFGNKRVLFFLQAFIIFRNELLLYQQHGEELIQERLPEIIIRMIRYNGGPNSKIIDPEKDLFVIPPLVSTETLWDSSEHQSGGKARIPKPKKGGLCGYRVANKATERYKSLKKAAKKDGFSTVSKRMTALATLLKNTNPKASQIIKKDRVYLKKFTSKGSTKK